ncbi:MAG TPA: hypothetical protein VNS63_03980 [Blastocatellia bacterium]|nr:hypothetical protein [Blastocatellia bacterium]
MRNYVAVVFNDTSKAYEGLHALWQLDDAAEVTVHGTAVVHRDALGNFQVDTKETHPALATAVGVGVGALLGLLAGPAGAAVGASGGAAIGAATGGMVGVAADLGRADTRDQAAGETGFVLGAGQSAVIADVSEDWTSPIDADAQPRRNCLSARQGRYGRRCMVRRLLHPEQLPLSVRVHPEQLSPMVG